VGVLDADQIHTPGHRLIKGAVFEKRIGRETTRRKEA
jgi:hypothetical protein